MTPNQLTEQTIAAFAAWTRKPAYPRPELERSKDGIYWEPCSFPFGDSAHYRLRPFILTRSINGHTLADGQQWHRSDFTWEDLPAPYRPFILGETGEGEVDYKNWQALESHELEVPTEDWHAKCRTTRPLPSVIAPGHNPAALTVSQVGEGWRLLDEDERPLKFPGSAAIERWSDGLKKWVEGEGDSPTATYRTRLSRSELAALDAPKTRAWDRASDVPFPWPIICETDSGPDDGALRGSQVMGVGDDGVGMIFKCGTSGILTWKDISMRKYEWTQDGKTFHPCTVPA